MFSLYNNTSYVPAPTFNDVEDYDFIVLANDAFGCIVCRSNEEIICSKVSCKEEITRRNKRVRSGFRTKLGIMSYGSQRLVQINGSKKLSVKWYVTDMEESVKLINCYDGRSLVMSINDLNTLLEYIERDNYSHILRFINDDIDFVIPFEDYYLRSFKSYGGLKYIDIRMVKDGIATKNGACLMLTELVELCELYFNPNMEL